MHLQRRGKEAKEKILLRDSESRNITQPLEDNFILTNLERRQEERQRDVVSHLGRHLGVLGTYRHKRQDLSYVRS